MHAMQRILVVDDSALMHSMFEFTLAKLPGCSVSFAKNGLEALDKIASEGDPSLILLDINMPVMDGLEFMDQLRRADGGARIPVIIVSTEGKDEDVLRGLEAGARAYLRKPFTAQELHDIIQRVMVS